MLGFGNDNDYIISQKNVAIMHLVNEDKHYLVEVGGHGLRKCDIYMHGIVKDNKVEMYEEFQVCSYSWGGGVEIYKWDQFEKCEFSYVTPELEAEYYIKKANDIIKKSLQKR